MCALLSSRTSGRRCPLYLACLAIGIVSLAGSVFAGDRPARVTAPPPAAAQTPPIVSPSWSADYLPLSPIGELFLRTFVPVASNDKGSTYTSGGESASLPAGPNALEQQKLEMARQAVEASRAAGTLWVSPLDWIQQTTPPLGAAARKLEQLRTAPSQPLQPDPSAAVGEMPSVQTPGSSELSAQERAKLDGKNAPPPKDGKEGTQP